MLREGATEDRPLIEASQKEMDQQGCQIRLEVHQQGISQRQMDRYSETDVCAILS